MSGARSGVLCAGMLRRSTSLWRSVPTSTWAAMRDTPSLGKRALGGRDKGRRVVSDSVFVVIQIQFQILR
eukprot:468874-Prymnesium_polylepis.1